MFKIPLQVPVSKDRLILSVYDYDSGKPDEKVGSIVLSIKELVANCSSKDGELRWVNIYGAPTGLVEGPNMKKMNDNPEQASRWKGRLLLHVQVSDSKSPEKDIVPID